MRIPFLPFLILITVTALSPLVSHASLVNQEWKDGVVIVLYRDQYGTGFWINDKNIVTAAHVVNYDLHGVAEVIKGDWKSDALVVYVNEKTDVAVLEVRNPTRLHYTFNIATRTETKKDIYVVGYPFEIVQLSNDIGLASETPRIARGFSAWYRPELQLLEFQATTDAGNSGGPVVYSNGAVVGIVSFAMQGKVGVMYFATTSEALQKDLALAQVDYETMEPPVDTGEEITLLDVAEKKVTIITGFFSIILAILSIYVYVRG